MPAHTDRFLAAGLVVLAVFIVVGIGALGGGNGRGFSFEPSYDPHTFSLGVVFTAVSIAVLSFLGFEGIVTLAEENDGSARRRRARRPTGRDRTGCRTGDARGCPRSRARPAVVNYAAAKSM